jgi:glutamine amidotransferase-like uncharacterized protein
MRAPFLVSVACISVAFSSCGARPPRSAPILLFNGAGTSSGDVAAVEAVLDADHLEFATANSWQMNEMSESQIGEYRLLIIPGGNFVKIGNGLTPPATTNIRKAVEHGLSYLGICAGGFFAGDSPYNGLNLTSGVRFGFYAAELQGIHKTAVTIATAGAAPLDQYWEDGPQFTGWGAVAGRYPDGTPALVEGTYGTGWVVLVGVHPEAPESWRRGLTFQTPASVDHAFAGTLIRAALNRTPLSRP